MIFSLSKDSNSKLMNLSSTLPILIETRELPIGDRFSYKFCNKITQVCGKFHSIPETGTLVLDYNGFCRLVTNSDTIINTLASELEITQQAAM